ncbi:MAG: DUF222 domain-containing protein [Glaciihabitans sp.]
MAIINPPPDREAWSAPEPGQSKKAKARRKRLATEQKPRVVVTIEPHMVLIPEEGENPDTATTSSAERVASFLHRAAERSTAKRKRADAEAAMTDDERAARDAQREEERRVRAEEQRREEEEGDEQTGTSSGPYPDNAARLRRYERVQDLLDQGKEAARRQAIEHAKSLRVIEHARREAFAIEYSYPLSTADPDSGTAETPSGRPAPTSDPESPDAVPVKWKIDAIAYRGFVAMVATTNTISTRAAELLVNDAITLHEDYEPTLQLLEKGGTSYRHAQIIADSGIVVPEEYRSEYEAILLPFADKLTPPQFKRKAQAVAATYKEDALEERHREALKDRSITLTAAEDGMADLHIYSDAVTATAIKNRLTGIAKGIHTAGDERTLKQVTVDVATELLLTGTTELEGTPTSDALNLSHIEPAGVTFREVPDDENVADVLGTGSIGKGLGSLSSKGLQVAIRVPAMTLLDHGSEQAYLEQYGPISMETATLLMANAPGFTRILTDPDTGAVLSVGTKQYKVPAAMRMWLMFRDQTCRFPGCTMPARYCDFDHTLDWQFGGETQVTNLIALCREHHNLKHHTGWRYTQDEDAIATWVSPSGRTMTTEPANRIPLRTSGPRNNGAVRHSEGAKKDSDVLFEIDPASDTHGPDSDGGITVA